MHHAGARVLCWLLFATGPAAHAGDAPGVFAALGPLVLHGDQKDGLSVGLGAYDFADSGTAAAATAEYRLGRKLWFIGPSVGVMVNSAGAVLGYLTAYFDLSWGRVHLTPQAGIAAYHEGSSRELGSVFQFRVSGDLTWRFEGEQRLGLRLAHVSNANTANPNPGEEELYVVYTIPFGPLL
jgi:lipid A 3-O-deacylase